MVCCSMESLPAEPEVPVCVPFPDLLQVLTLLQRVTGHTRVRNLMVEPTESLSAILKYREPIVYL